MPGQPGTDNAVNSECDAGKDRQWLAERLQYENAKQHRLRPENFPKKIHPLLHATRDRLQQLATELEQYRRDFERQQRAAKASADPQAEIHPWHYFARQGQILVLPKTDFSIRVSAATWKRAIGIINALIYMAQARGHGPARDSRSNRLCLHINSSSYFIRISEKLALAENEREAIQGSGAVSENPRIKVPTGVLRLYVSASPISEVLAGEDGEMLLEERLNDVFCQIYRFVLRDRIRRRMLEERRKNDEQNWQRKKEIWQLEQKELARQAMEKEQRTALLLEASSWRQAKLILDYVAHVDQVRVETGSSKDATYEQWRVWALSVALELDPTANRLSMIAQRLPEPST